ncbi:MAG: FAD-dependent oxidoreductase [Bacteroidia bacterium]|nr:FAD-dependent oxidoreductase [Bacteroidia bacterium]
MKLYQAFNDVVLWAIRSSSPYLFNWAARAVDKLPKQTALHKSYHFDGKVVIIGAGGAGLAAAKILERNNIDYLILEASDRYGGRLKKDITLADFPIDLGAEWIHSNPKVLNIIKGKNGDEIDEELIPYKLNTALNWDGKELKPAKSYLKYFYDFMPESKFKNSTWFDFLDQHIAQEVRHKIVYHSPVISVEQTGDKVFIKTQGGNAYEADKVLITIPIGVLKSNKIKFSPELSPDKQKAIDSISFLTGFKVAMKFSERFYPDLIQCETGYGLKGGEKSYFDMAFGKNTESNILGFLCAGKAASSYYALDSEGEIIEALIEELDQMFDGRASKAFSGEYRLENWGQQEFTQGTWVVAPFEKTSNLKALAEPIENKIYFASGTLDPYKQMGAPGSMLAGYHYIDKLLLDK